MRSFDASPGTAPEPTVAQRLQWLMEVGRRRWLILVSVTVVATLVAGMVAGGRTEQYSATAKVLLGSSPIIGSTEPGEARAPSDPEREINTKIGLIRLEAVARRVMARLELQISQAALARKVTATPEGTTDIVDVTATDASPTRAAAIANGFAHEYVAFRKRVARSTLKGALRGVRRLVEPLSAAELVSARGRALESRIHELEIESATQTGGAQVVLNASTPASPTGPQPLSSALLGAVIGLMLALVMVAVLELSDRRVRRSDEPDPFDEREFESLFHNSP